MIELNVAMTKQLHELEELFLVHFVLDQMVSHQ